MTAQEYPHEIYREFPSCGSQEGNLAAHYAGRQHAYRIGLTEGAKQNTQSDQLEGYSNLTWAIHSDVSIDWEKLDMRPAKCVHSDFGVLTHLLLRNVHGEANSPKGWCDPSFKNTPWALALSESWKSGTGWALWIEGEVPCKTRTADILEPGTRFTGKCGGFTSTCFVFIDSNGHKKVHLMGDNAMGLNPADIEVVEVHSRNAER